MSSGMNLEEAKQYAETMSYRKAINNIRHAKGIAYKKATWIKMTSAHTDVERKNDMWKTIKGFSNYSVSDLGDIKNNRKGNFVKPSIGTGNYLYIRLTDDSGKSRTKRLHRIVADAFCTKKADATEVNHIDGDKANNKADNLEWVTKSENMNHAYRTGLQTVTHKGKVRSVKCLNDGMEFGTISEASEHYGVSKSQIYWCCRRESKRCRLKFRFTN